MILGQPDACGVNASVQARHMWYESFQGSPMHVVLRAYRRSAGKMSPAGRPFLFCFFLYLSQNEGMQSRTPAESEVSYEEGFDRDSIYS